MACLEQARDAITRYCWREAYQILAQADVGEGLEPEALEILGDACWWLSRIDDCINARARAYAGYIDAGNEPKAGMMCIRLAEDHFQRKADNEAAERQSLCAWKLWTEADAPFEAAQARVLLGQACQRRRSLELARLELQAAQRVFDRLGAERDLAFTRSLLGEEAVSATKRILRAMMFTDIVRSTELIDAIGDGAWNHLIRWHDHTLRSLFAVHGGTENDHAGDGFSWCFGRLLPPRTARSTFNKH